MVDRFTTHINQHFSELRTAKILIAVSGGLDSMVLTHLCNKTGLQASWAHCNFNLRGEESDADTAFVQGLAHELDITCYVEYFDTYAFAKAYSQSTQMAARTLRYEWFDKLQRAHGYDFILTAHHANDEIETFLINLSRGTGLEGLKGIPARNGAIRRVLLPFTRAEIEDYATSHGIQWREDSSNATDHYLRNHLRHHAIPELEKAAPQFIDGFKNTQEYLKQASALLQDYTKVLKDQLLITTVQSGREGYEINIAELQSHDHPASVLYALLSPCGFTAWEDIYTLPEATSGKQVFSKTHQLLKDRDALLLFERSEKSQASTLWEENSGSISGAFGRLEASESNQQITGKSTILVDREKLEYPLTVRRWQEGDYFYPFGMKGKKKVSKYLKDEKLSLIAKEQVYVLCSGQYIVWVIGLRADDRYRVTPQTQKSLKIIHSYEL